MKLFLYFIKNNEPTTYLGVLDRIRGILMLKIKKMRRILIISFVFISNICFAQKTTNLHSVKDLKKDYAKLREHLETKNPITYLYSSREHITTYLDSIEGLITQEMTELDFYRLISPIASLTKDGHNLIMPSDDAINFIDQHPHNLPLSIGLLNGELFIKGNYSNNPDLQPRYKVNSINNISSTTILERLYLTLPSEGYQTQLPTSHINQWFAFFYHLQFGFQEKYTIKYTDLKGQQKEAIIKGNTLDEIIKKRKTQATPTSKNKGISVEIMDTTLKIARLNIPTFSPVFLKNRYHQKKFKREIDKCFDIIFQNNIQHLIIDVRYNGGGNPAYSVELLRYLFDEPFTHAIEGRVIRQPNKENIMERTTKRWFPWYGIGTFKLKQKHYAQKVYALINGGTFSAAVEFVSTLKKYNRAIFIGEETGGNPVIMTGNYLKESRKLPNTKITHYSGKICTIYRDLDTNTGRGIIPDYPVQLTIDDVLSKRDIILDRALSLIKAGK